MKKYYPAVFSGFWLGGSTSGKSYEPMGSYEEAFVFAQARANEMDEAASPLPAVVDEATAKKMQKWY